VRRSARPESLYGPAELEPFLQITLGLMRTFKRFDIVTFDRDSTILRQDFKRLIGETATGGWRSQDWVPSPEGRTVQPTYRFCVRELYRPTPREQSPKIFR
jgi:hypothetical protein